MAGSCAAGNLSRGIKPYICIYKLYKREVQTKQPLSRTCSISRLLYCPNLHHLKLKTYLVHAAVKPSVALPTVTPLLPVSRRSASNGLGEKTFLIWESHACQLYCMMCIYSKMLYCFPSTLLTRKNPLRD